MCTHPWLPPRAGFCSRCAERIGKPPDLWHPVPRMTSGGSQMQDWQRYAVFAVPEGRFYEAGAAWLGWDCVAGAARTQPDLPGLPMPATDLTARPQKYGFHGTLRPPFRLAEGQSPASLRAAVAGLAAQAAPVSIPELKLTALGRFLAFVPALPHAPLNELAAQIVTGLNPLRAPLTASELEKRQTPRLTPRQAALLGCYGYPYVLDQFRFHLTLTAPVPHAAQAAVAESLSAHFAPILPRPYRIDDLALMGQAADGRFHLLERFRLEAPAATDQPR